MYQLTDEDRALARQIAQSRGAATAPEQKSGGLGSFLLGLLPGGSLLDKGMRGEQITGGDVATEVGLSLVPFGLGKIARGVKGLRSGRAATALSGKSGSPALPGDALPQASKGARVLGGRTVEAPPAGSKFTLPGKLREWGNNALLNQYGTIGKPVARSTSPTQTVSELADIGITKPEDAERIASMFTGSGGLVNKAVLKATGNAKGVDLANLRTVFDDAISSTGVVDKDAKSLKSVFDAQMERLYGGRTGTLNPLANPSETLAVMKAFEKRQANLLGKGDNYRLTTPERADQAAVLGLVTDELEDALYRGAGADKNLKKVLTPKLREDLLALKPGDQQWEKFVADKVMGAGSVADLRSSMAPFVRIRKIIDEGDVNALTFGGRAGNMLSGGGLLSGVREAAGSLLTGPVSRAAGTTLRSAGDAIEGRGKVGGVGASSAEQALRSVSGTGGGMMSNPLVRFLAPQAGVRAGADVLGLRGDEPAAAAMGAEQMLAGDMGMPGLGGSLAPKPQTMYTKEAVAKDIQNDLMATGGANMDKYITLYEFLNGGSGGDMNATTQKALAQSANADATLGQLEGLLQQAGGAGGPVAGNIASFFGGLGLNNDVKTYNDLVNGSITQIAKALGETGAMSDADRAAYSKLLPKVTDTPEVAAQKFAALRERMTTAQQNTMQFGGGGAADILSSLGY